MSSDSDEVRVARAHADPEDEDLTIAAPPSGPVGRAGDASRQRGRRWSYPAEDMFLCWMLVDPPEPALPSDRLAPSLRCLLEEPGRSGCLGVARCKWMLRKSSEEAIESHSKVSTSLLSADKAVGFLQYEVTNLFLFDDPCLFQGEAQQRHRERTLRLAYGDFALDGGLVKDVMTNQELDTSLILSADVASSLLFGDVSIARSICWGGQLRYINVVKDFPPHYTIKHHWARWIKAGQQEPGRLPASTDARAPQQRPLHKFLKMAAKRRKCFTDEKLKKPTKRSKYDPIKLIRTLSFQHELRDERAFSFAMEKSRKVDADPSDDEAKPRCSKNDPSRSTRQRARHKFDVVLMLLERADVLKWLEEDLIDSVHAFTDASPVTGVELQGQVLDCALRNNVVHRRLLPGAELAYGHTGATSKAITLLWGIF